MSWTDPAVTSLSTLTAARYGKDLVRLLRVVRGPTEDGKSKHEIAEYTVQVLLEGDIEKSYTKADNSVVVATDSMKNIVYYLAKTSPHILSPTHYAMHVGAYLAARYPHVARAHVKVEGLRWSRIAVDGEAHPHAFWRDGDEKVLVEVEVSRTPNNTFQASVKAGLKDLLILKSTGSGFTRFVRDENTTLPEVTDRIFSTSVDALWDYGTHPLTLVEKEVKGKDGEAKKEWDLVLEDGKGKGEGSVWDKEVVQRVRGTTLEVFAKDDSESVQATLYRTAQLVIAQNAGIQSIEYKLPNKHYAPVDMSYRGVENVAQAEAEVFMPLSLSGLITATVTRK